MINLKEKYPNGFVHGLVAGHGGIINGEYQILKKGSKQHTFPDGLTIYEGEQNRLIKDTLLGITDWETDVEIIDLIPGQKDVPLNTRVEIINKTFEEYKRQGKLLLVWEIHLNAFNSKVKGTEVYSTTKDNLSDEMANIWLQKVKKEFPNQVIRGHKEKDYAIINNIDTFGILVECFFFDNREEVDLYCNSKGYYNWALTMLFSMLELNKKYYG